MSTQKLEYDSTMGGTVVLDSHISTYRYAAAALKEMRQLLDSVQQPTSTKLVFQTLPKHMRRRAMSHHPKRLPRKYRSAHIAQMLKAGDPKPTKRPSRKYRRRPSNLLRDYLRRQRKHTWLETHIWHARRFHMINRWGYRLPYASCDKTYRACYRASAQHCLLQDISFYSCLQLMGSLTDIREGFQRISSSKCGLSITAKTFVSGRREGYIDLFKSGLYPEGALGRVSFIWQPIENNLDTENVKRIVWLWVHPSSYQAILMEILQVFELIPIMNQNVKSNADVNKENMNSIEKEIGPKETTKTRTKARKRFQVMSKRLAYERIKHYNNSTGSIELVELKNTMNRFRLTGPLSQSVLASAFKTKQYNNSKESKNWFRNLCTKDPTFQEIHETQNKYWEYCSQLETPAEVMSNIIIGLNIEDPRIHRPQKRTKAFTHLENNLEAANMFLDPPSNLAQSAIWNDDVRNNICEQMLTTHEYCKLREKHALVPGANCMFEQELQPVPVLLIQRPGSQNQMYKRLGYGNGWDVIAPAGYGMVIWMSLIMWGARPGGLREFETIAREMGTDEHLPDTVGGMFIAAERFEELHSKYFRLPSNKRCNYRKFAIASPFRVPFKELVRDWSAVGNSKEVCNDNSKSFYILRDRLLLRRLALCLSNKEQFPQELACNALIQVQLLMKSRGNPGNYALICLPTQADFKENLKRMQQNKHDPVCTEPLLPDLYEKERKELRMQHKKLLKRLRARRVREKRKKQETCTTRVFIRAAGTSELVSAQFKKMCKLWLPDDLSTLYSVRKQCTREVFGYVTNCSFSFTEATVCAVGYITPTGLRELLELCKRARLKNPMCLVRGTKTRSYRFASLKIHAELT